LTNEEALIDRAIAVVADTIDLAMGCKERIHLLNLFYGLYILPSLFLL
jgi:hypothetical protein